METTAKNKNDEQSSIYHLHPVSSKYHQIKFKNTPSSSILNIDIKKKESRKERKAIATSFTGFSHTNYKNTSINFLEPSPVHHFETTYQHSLSTSTITIHYTDQYQNSVNRSKRRGCPSTDLERSRFATSTARDKTLSFQEVSSSSAFATNETYVVSPSPSPTQLTTTGATTPASHQFLGRTTLVLVTAIPALLFFIVLVFLCCECRKKSSHKRRSVTLVSYNSKQNTSQKKLNPDLYGDLYGDTGYDCHVTEEDKKDSPFNRIYRSTMRHTFNKFKFRSTQKRNEVIEFYNLQLKPVSEVLNESCNLRTSGLYNDQSFADIAVVLSDDRKQEKEETKMNDEVDKRNVDVDDEGIRDVENNRIACETNITNGVNSRSDETNTRADNVLKNTPELYSPFSYLSQDGNDEINCPKSPLTSASEENKKYVIISVDVHNTNKTKSNTKLNGIPYI